MSVSQRALREELGAGLFTRERVVPVALGLLAVLLVFLIVHDVLFPASSTGTTVSTAAVTRGTVRSAVTGTGTVQPVTQQSVNFGQSGTLTEIDVKVADKVTKGQTLARIDPTTLQQALDQANNNLASAQASLNNTVNGNAVQQAQHNLANAQQSLADTQAQVNLTNQQDQNQLATDTAQLNTDQNTTLPQAQQALTDCQAKPPTNDPTCSSKQQAVTQAQAAVTSDQNKVNQDNNKIATDQLSGQRSINQATNSVTSAQDALSSQTISRPNTIAQQQASLSNAQIAVQTAQRNLNYATLTAPFDGTILAVNSQVGDTVAGGTGSSSNSSSAASSSGSSSGSGSSGAGSSSAGGSSTSSTGSGFIVMGDMTGFQVVAPFAEADAARVQANQQATVTFDAITGLSITAHVLMVQGTATVVSNVTNYNVTLVLDQIDQRLRSGMTANANVVVQQAQNVLTLPNSVITRIAGAAFVTLLGKDGKTQTRQPVQTGAVGDTSTEVVAGLNLGDRVVRPQLKTTTGSSATGAGRGSLGTGGGTVRIGGG